MVIKNIFKILSVVLSLFIVLGSIFFQFFFRVTPINDYSNINQIVDMFDSQEKVSRVEIKKCEELCGNNNQSLFVLENGEQKEYSPGNISFLSIYELMKGTGIIKLKKNTFDIEIGFNYYISPCYKHMYYINSPSVEHLKYLEQNSLQIKKKLAVGFLIYDYKDDFLPSRCDLFGY